MSDRSSLRYRERRPVAKLVPHVECLWMAWSPRRNSLRSPEHIVPDACPELIVHLGDPFSRRIGSRWRRQPRVFLAGTLSRPWTLRAGPEIRTLGIRFRPGAVTSILPLHMRLATDREVALRGLVGAVETRALVRGIEAESTFTARVRAAERWLLERLPGNRRALGSDVLRPAVERVLRGRGRERIDEVAAALGLTRRRLERLFDRHLGIRPKLFARIVRLNSALATLGKTERARAVDIALEAGYFDQAHMARDFRTVAGHRLGADRRSHGEMSRHFTDPGRLLAFLAGE